MPRARLPRLRRRGSRASWRAFLSDQNDFVASWKNGRVVPADTVPNFSDTAPDESDGELECLVPQMAVPVPVPVPEPEVDSQVEVAVAAEAERERAHVSDSASNIKMTTDADAAPAVVPEVDDNFTSTFAGKKLQPSAASDITMFHLEETL